MAQYIGLILLILAVAAGLYIATNTENILKLKLDIPLIVRPVLLPETGGSGAISGENGISEEEPSNLETENSVVISSIRPADYSNYLEVVISSNLGETRVADITGWTIKSNKGTYIIPKAQEAYSFGGNQSDIILKYGDEVHIYSGFGPKGNFRLNRCMGYIEDLSPFTPSIRKECPSFSRSEISDFSPECQDYLLSLNSCENPLANPPVPPTDDACHNFLSKLNYVGCVAKYNGLPDFFSDEWRIWGGDQINIFNAIHDKVQLLDRSGKIIDEYTY